MPTCFAWGKQRHEDCSQTADEGYNECSAAEDRGYNECSATEDRGYNECCDWPPCSWACDAMVWIRNIVCVLWTWVSNVVCVAWTWISNVVCVAWAWVTTAFCIIWDAIVAVVNVFVTIVEGFFGALLSGFTAIVELVYAIPFVGPIIRGAVNVFTQFVSVVVSAIDFFAGLIGIRPEKRLRICTVILQDDKGNRMAADATVIQALQLAADVYKRDANVRIMPMGLWQFRHGFSGADTVTADWLTDDPDPSSASMLDNHCRHFIFGLDGSVLQLKVTSLCFTQGWRRVLGYGAPVTCFIVRNMTKAGCCNGTTNYVRVNGVSGMPPASARTIGHEVGHACLLSHRCVDDDASNLMATQDECDPTSTTPEDRTTPRLTDWQALVIRASKHVTYF